MEQNTIPVKDGNDDDMQDMAVTNEGTMKQDAEEQKNEVTPPEAMTDVSAPPQDQVIEEPQAEDEVREAPEEVKDDTVSPSQQKEEVVLPAGADPVHAHVAHQASNKGLVVAIAIVLALVLVSIAVLIFFKANSSTKEASKTTDTTTQQTSQAAPAVATENDVDTAAAEVDQVLSGLDENKDFSADGLSDKTLGLQ